MPFAPYAYGMISDAAERDALAVIQDAAQRCFHEEVRGADLDAALAFLRGRTGRQGFFRQLDVALAMENPDARWQNVNAAVNGINRQFGKAGR